MKHLALKLCSLQRVQFVAFSTYTLEDKDDKIGREHFLYKLSCHVFNAVRYGRLATACLNTAIGL